MLFIWLIHNCGCPDNKFHSFTAVYMHAAILDCEVRVGEAAPKFMFQL